MLRLITKLEAFLGVAQLLSQYGRRDKKRLVADITLQPDVGHRDPALLYSGA
jgi:hypothetical protein